LTEGKGRDILIERFFQVFEKVKKVKKGKKSS